MSAERLADIVGVPPQFFMTGVAGYCAGARCEIFEFKDAPPTGFHSPLQNPGTGFLSVWVSNVDDLLAAAKAGGVEVVTTGGRPVSVKLDDPLLVGAQGTGAPVSAHTSR